MGLGPRHDVVDHGHEAHVRIVLQTHTVQSLVRVARVLNRETTGWQQAIRLQLFTTQTHHHDLATEIGVQADVAQSADGDFGAWRVNGDAAAVAVL